MEILLQGKPVKTWIVALLVSSFFVLPGIAGIGSYALGNGQGYQSGYSQGHAAGYSQGNTDGYNRGLTDGYSQGYNAELDNFQQWLNQSCFNYPFLLLDESKYMACHR